MEIYNRNQQTYGLHPTFGVFDGRAPMSILSLLANLAIGLIQSESTKLQRCEGGNNFWALKPGMSDGESRILELIEEDNTMVHMRLRTETKNMVRFRLSMENILKKSEDDQEVRLLLCCVAYKSIDGKGQVIKINKHFLSTFTLSTNYPERCEFTYGRGQEGRNTHPDVRNYPATVASAMNQ